MHPHAASARSRALVIRRNVECARVLASLAMTSRVLARRRDPVRRAIACPASRARVGFAAARNTALAACALAACALAALPACNALFGLDVRLADDGGLPGALECSVAAPPCAATAVPVAGDWDGNGTDTPGLFDAGRWCITNTSAPGDVCALQWGTAGVSPVVGDWNGDRVDSPGWYLDAFWSLKHAGAGGETAEFQWGSVASPLGGDWDGRDHDTPGSAVEFSEHLTWSLSNRNSSGGVDYELTWGLEGDLPLVGDWDGNGTDTPALFRDGQWTFRNVNIMSGDDAASFRWGGPGDTPIVGDWNADGVDTVGLYRDGTWMLADDRIETIAGSGGPLVVTTFRWGSDDSRSR
jgi:hypothetical protein